MNITDSKSMQSAPLLSAGQTSLGNRSANRRAALKARLARILSASSEKKADRSDNPPTHFTFGVDALDQPLCGHGGEPGLPRAALHEIHGAGRDDLTSTAAFSLLLAERCRHADTVPDRPVLWVSEGAETRRQGRLYPPGLAELGLDPAQIIHVEAADSIAALRAAAEGTRSPAMAAVIVALSGRKPKGLNLTATRRLSLSARESGVLTLLLRSGSDPGDPMPSAAWSRWQVAAAPSASLAANAPGHPAFDISLLRHRSGLYGLDARLEWNREQHIFRALPAGQDTPDTGAVPALPAVGADHPATQVA